MAYCPSKTFFIISLTCIFLAVSISGFWYVKGRIFCVITKKHIVCTTSMITDAVKNIVGNAVEVHGLMGPGIDPHLYRVRESDVHHLHNADIIFYNGLHLEGKLADILEKMDAYIPTVAVSGGISSDVLRKAENSLNIYDPHIWFDISLWILVVRYICDNLVRVYPQYKKDFQKRTASYVHQLTMVEHYVKTLVQCIPEKKRILITAHDAFGYFGRRYKFKVIGLQGMSTESVISPHDVSHLAQYIVRNRVKAIFPESSISPRSMHALNQAISAYGWHIIIGGELFSDALGDVHTKAGTYIGMMRHNIDTIVKTLA